MLYLLLKLIEQWHQRGEASWLLSALRILNQITFRALAAAGVSFAIVMFLAPRTIAWLRRMKIGDSGLTDAAVLERAAQSKANTPTMGGVLIAGAIAISTLLLADLSHFFVYASLVVLVWLAAVGGADDWLKLTSARRGAGGRQGLYAWEKLVFQLGLGLLVGWFLYQQTAGQPGGPVPADVSHALNLPFQKTYNTPADQSSSLINPGVFFLPRWLFITLAVLMMTGMSNAVNITDGMDGLATGVTGVVTMGLLVLTVIAGSALLAGKLLVPYIPRADELAVVSGAMLGACLGFLWWNCAPAQVFMGDTGALCLGGLIGFIASAIRQEYVVLVMSGVFLAEIGSVALQVGCFRLTGGRRVFRVAPYHHHLHLGGWTEPQIVVRAWIISVLLVILALASIKVR